MTLHLLHHAQHIRQQVREWQAAGRRVALVPTMGALHAGHMALVNAARGVADAVVVSVFVNPTQFGPNEDFSSYPRQLEMDTALCADHGVDAVYAPSVEEMYPNGFATRMSVTAPLVEVLCGASRPGHFDGVAIVVSKLLLQALPDVALFGEKDFQQLQVIRRVVVDVNIPVEIMGVPTQREHDGLALSSRNAYLLPEERAVAPALHQTLQHMAERLRAGEALTAVLTEGRNRIVQVFHALDYLDLRRERDLYDAALLPQGAWLAEPCRLFVAAKLGKARLIDNVRV